MPKPRSWSDEQLSDALALASRVGLREAARVTGIPFGTLGRWKAKLEHGKQNETAKAETEAIRVSIEEKVEQIDTAIAADAPIAEKARRMATDLYRLAEKARGQIDEALDTAKAGKKRVDPQWARVLVGVLAQSIEKAQLLSGKSTVRVEGAVTHTADMSQVLADPEARELARLLFRKKEGGQPEEAAEETGSLLQ